MGAAWIGPVAERLGRVEVDVGSGSDRIVGIQHSLHDPITGLSLDDRGGDPVAGPVEQLQVEELRWIRSSAANQMGVQPLARDPLELPEQMEWW